MESALSVCSAKGYKQMTTALPKVRNGLSVTDLGNELIVFDTATSNAHCLDKVGSVVFLACRDGENIDSLEQKLGADYSAESVEIALAQLEELSLLEKSPEGVTRRQALETMGVAALGVVVASVAAPTPAAAQSCDTCRTHFSGGRFVPCDCSGCGQPCSDKNATGLDCAPSNSDKGPCSPTFVCAFEFVFRSASTTGCVQDNGLGYACRNVDGFFYDANCATARAALLAANGNNPNAANGKPYYCCSCPGAATTCFVG